MDKSIRRLFIIIIALISIIPTLHATEGTANVATNTDDVATNNTIVATNNTNAATNTTILATNNTNVAEGIKVKVSGRLHLDASTYFNAPDTLSTRLDITELRLAAKVTYKEWYLKLDVGFAQNKLKIKDAFAQWHHKGHCLRAGYMLGFFGIDQSISTNDFTFNSGANICETYYNGRHNGISYTYSIPHWYISAGMFIGDGLVYNANTKPGQNASLRALWRPINRDKNILHLGCSGIVRRPDLNRTTGLRPITISSKGVTYTASPALQHLIISDATTQYEAGAEIFYTHYKLLVQAEYLFMAVQRKNAQTYCTNGGYLQLGWLIKGTQYNYDNLDALPYRPTDNGSLLMILRYNINNLNDMKTGLIGGNQQDLSIGLNYYINRYFCTHLNYTWLHLYDSPINLRTSPLDIHQLQCKLQFAF